MDRRNAVMILYLSIFFIGTMFSPLRGDGDVVRQYFWGKESCVIHTRKVGDVKYYSERFTAKGDIQTLTYPQTLREFSNGWLQPGKYYDYHDLACLSRVWPGGMQTVKPAEPDKAPVEIDPAVIPAIFSALQKGTDPNKCIEMLRLAMEGNDLLQPVMVATYDNQLYHRASCPVINAARFAAIWNKEVTLLDALLNGRKPCEKCKPVEVTP